MGLFSKKSAPQPSARPEYIEVGQIVNTHGVRGEVKVQPWDVSPELLCGFKTFYMDGAPFRPTSKRVQGDMVLMKLPEVDDMDAAAALKRKVLSIRRNDRSAPANLFFMSLNNPIALPVVPLLFLAAVNE